MQLIVFFIIMGIYYFIGIKVANKLGVKDSYEEYIIACLFPIFLIIEGLINLFYFIKEKLKKFIKNNKNR